MPNTLNGMSAAANEATFQNRVRAAMLTAAVAIAGESTAGMTTTVYQKRQKLATCVLNDPLSWAAKFAMAVATSTTVAAGVLNPVAISSSSTANPLVITTAANHGLTTGDQVAVLGHLVNTVANGGWTATSLTATTFSIPTAGTAAGAATGTVTKQPPDSDIQTAVNSMWNDIAGITGSD